MFVLILGSYDSDTKRLLYSLRECLTRKFVIEGHHFLLMEMTSLFKVEDGRYVITEEDGKNNVTLYIFPQVICMKEIEVEMIDTIKLEGGLEETVSKYITAFDGSTTRIQMERARITGETGLFDYLVEICSLYSIIRLKEESRGGEYLELCQILKMKERKLVRQERDIYYFNKVGNVHSTMLNLFLDSKELMFRDFNDENNLCQQLEELVRGIGK